MQGSDTVNKGEKAKNYFLSGYNCSQSVAMAFSEEMGMDTGTVARLVSGFGGGMGRMREVCGAVSGMVFVISALYGYDKSEQNNEKAQLYNYIQQVGGAFREANGSIVCRELLGLNSKGFEPPVPEQRTKEYYKKRPCSELVEMAADILDDFIRSKEK